MVYTCRLCLTEDPEEKLKNVFQCKIKHAEDSLVDVLFWVFSVEIDVTDSFSKNICSECVQLIEYILQVKNTFQKNQESLRDHQQRQNCDILEVSTLDGCFIEKVSNNGQNSSASSTTPTSSPSKSRNAYGSCSPRVRVSLSTLKAMSPMNLNLVQFENSQEYLRYRQLKNGSFKKRKYRHFQMDETLLEDICSTLDENECAKTDPLRKEIGVSTEISLLSKAVNTDERITCTCNQNIKSPLKFSSAGTPSSIDLLSTDTCKKGPEDTLPNDDNFLDVISVTRNVSGFSSPAVSQEYDWTMLTFKKDVCTNTETNTSTTKSIGITATVPTVTSGTLTKNFKRMKKKNIVQVKIESLQSFGPTVVLEPLEDILEEENYRQIGEFRYVKRDYLSSESEPEEDLEESELESDLKQNTEINKKQKFLDYYKNFSSFAVRELITGKKIRESDNDSSPVFKVANVCNVFVCEYCSKSFLSQISLNLHYRRAHKTLKETNDVIEVIDLVNESKTSIKKRVFQKKIVKKQRRSTEKPMANIKVETSKEGNFVNGDCTTKTSIEPSVEYRETIKETNGYNSNDDNAESKVAGLKRKAAQKVNHNINDIIKLKTKKQMPPKVKPKRRRKSKLKCLKNFMLVSKNQKDISYVWDRKSLGKYSAISYYKNYSGDEKGPHLDLANCDITQKTDLALNETIQKLANRLDESCDSDKNVCDNVTISNEAKIDECTVQNVLK